MSRLLVALIAFAPLFAADPPGFAVWKASDLKQKAATQELANTADYQVSLVRQESNGAPQLSQTQAEILIVETGTATLVVGGQIRGDGIENGEHRELSEGDVVHIPANLPHQVLVAPGQRVTYLTLLHQASGDESAPPAPIIPTGKKPEIGPDLGSGFRACLPGDSSPSGTVVDGYRKVSDRTFMGKSCLWEPVQEPEIVFAGDAKDKPKMGRDNGDGYRSCVPGEESPSGTVVDGYRKVSHPSPFGLSCAWEKIK